MKPFDSDGGLSAFGKFGAAAGPYTYALVKSGPDVDPDEVEIRSAIAVEVVVLWGTNVLHVDHLSPPRSFFVGDGTDGACDYVVPTEKIGTTRAPVVLVSDGSIDLVVLPRAEGTIDLPGERRAAIKDLVARGRSTPCVEVPGAVRVALRSGAKARVEIDGLIFQVSAVPPGKAPAVPLFADADNSTPLYVGLSLMAHVGLFAMMAFLVPPMDAETEASARADERYLMMQYLNSAAEREREAALAEHPADSEKAEAESGTGTRAVGEEGKTGNPNSTETGHRYGIKGPADNTEPRIARDVALRDAAKFGMIGLLGAAAGGDPNAPTAPWGGNETLGTDPMSARGNMWGDSIGDSIGAGGLGLTGIGEGGGGTGEGIGVGPVGTIGHGAGAGTDQGFGSCKGCRGLGGAGHAARVPQLRTSHTEVNGRLPAEVIQRIVRQNFGRFRVCYENGLRSNPSLQGRVEVRFVIGRDGAVMNAGNGNSDLPDAAVVRCVLQAYYGLSFPKPESGIVRVVYPIMFSPG